MANGSHILEKNFPVENLIGSKWFPLDPIEVTNWLSENLTGTDWEFQLESNGNFQLYSVLTSFHRQA